MIKTVFILRFRQFYRLMSSVGTYRLIIMLFVFAVLSFVVFNSLILKESTVPALLIIGLALLAIHASRKDKHFLKLNGKNVYSVYLCEYIFLVSPFLIIWIIYQNWIGSGVLLIYCLFIPLLYLNLGTENSGSFIKSLIHPFSSNLNFKFNIKLPFIPINAFEWISGIRRNLPVIIPIYLLILAFSLKPYVAPAGIVFLSILFSGFYLYGESRTFIELIASNARQFILRKISISFKCLLIIISPIIIIALIFQLEYWYLLAIALFLASLIQIFAIIFKYALFAENANLSRNGLIVSLNIVFIIIPLFWPVPIIMGARYYFKALKNLKIYFND